jgi:hypothetical protein
LLVMGGRPSSPSAKSDLVDKVKALADQPAVYVTDALASYDAGA